MSEAIDELAFTLPPAPVRDAAVVILVRERDGQRELFWVRRGEDLAFSGGFHAFPGGGLDPGDVSLPVAGAPPGDEAFRGAALRELFEETGVLLAAAGTTITAARRDELRQELLAGGDFGAITRRERIVLDGARLIPAGRWVTPGFSPIRFDARFYLACVPAATTATVIPGELTDGCWVRPSEALARWEAGTALLHPPNHHALATLAGHTVEGAVARLRDPPFVDGDHIARRIEFQRGIIMLPLRAPTLPPATHTNCYIVGTGELAIVDPGSPDADEQDRLERAVRDLMGEGRRAKAVLLTHHHRDHVGAAVEIGRRLAIPVWSSAETARRLDGIDGRLVDGSPIELDGPRPMRLHARLTEGHARGHMCFQDEASGAVLAGDMVAGGSTIVIDPPEGDMGSYLMSLKRLLALGATTLYPAHGLAIPDGTAKLREYIDHREQRMHQIREALERGFEAVDAIVERVYADTPPFLHPIAVRSALASLIEMERRGLAHREGDRWLPA